MAEPVPTLADQQIDFCRTDHTTEAVRSRDAERFGGGSTARKRDGVKGDAEIGTQRAVRRTLSCGLLSSVGEGVEERSAERRAGRFSPWVAASASRVAAR